MPQGYTDIDLTPDTGYQDLDLEAPVAPSAPRGWLDEVKDYLKSAAEGLDPVTNTARGLSMLAHPIDTAKAIGRSHAETEAKAEAAFKSGRYAEGARHLFDYLIPVIGPAVDTATDKLQAGRVGEGLGDATAIAGNLLMPQALQGGAAPAAARIAAKNPAVADAVAWGMREGIPVDAATATQNPAVRSVQHLADRSLGQTVTGIADRAARAQAEGLTAAGDRLAARAAPAPVTTEQAGASLRSAVEGRMANLHAQADTAYSALRDIETRTPILVDLRASKAALKSVFDRLMRQYPVAQQQASPGLKAIQNILEGPDLAPLSQADADLSAIKTLARADLPAVRSQGQGVAAGAVTQMERAVQQAMRHAPAEARVALQAGRKATIAKHATQEAWEALKAEPVRTVKGLTAPQDSAIRQLRELQTMAPEELPKMGRAYLDDLLHEATQTGGFDHAKSLHAKWTKLGPETKRLLYRDADYIKDLDRFFLLSSKMAETPNPSGTAHNLLMATQGGWLLTEPITGAASQLGLSALSALLHSPRGVRLLTQGLTVPVAHTARASVTAGQLLRMVQEAQTRMVLPAAATNTPPEGPGR